MPLTKSGKSILGEMKEKHGSKKGTSIFYASINKGNPGTKKWHKKPRDILG